MISTQVAAHGRVRELAVPPPGLRVDQGRVQDEPVIEAEDKDPEEHLHVDIKREDVRYIATK